MTNIAATTTVGQAVRWSSRRELRILAAAAFAVAAGLAVWPGIRSDVRTRDDRTDTAAITAGLSRELLADELTAIRRSRVSGTGSTTEQTESGLSQELLADELAAIRGATASGRVSMDGPTESGLSQELLNGELAAIRGQ